MNIEGMEVESNPALHTPRSALDWGRIGYWVINFIALAVMLAALALFCYGAWVLGVAVWRFAQAISWAEFFRPIRRGFYTVCVMLFFFYAVRGMRAGARWLEAKVEKEQEEV